MPITLMFASKKLLVLGIVVAAVLFGLWWTYTSGFNAGVARERAALQVAVEAERARQEIIIKELRAITEAQEVELRKSEQGREGLARKLRVESQRDPDNARPAVSSDGVRRLNQIR